MILQFPHNTTVWAWLNTVVIWKHPGHLISMKKELGLCTSLFSLCVLASTSGDGCNKSAGIFVFFWPKQYETKDVSFHNTHYNDAAGRFDDIDVNPVQVPFPNQSLSLSLLSSLKPHCLPITNLQQVDVAKRSKLQTHLATQLVELICRAQLSGLVLVYKQ